MTKTTFFLLKCPGKTDLRVSKDGDDGGGESSTNRYETLLESVTTRHHALERAESVNEDLKEKLVSFQCNSLLKEHSLKTQLAKARSKPFPRSWHDMPNLPFTHKHPLLATIGDVMLACHCLSPTLYLMNATTCRLTTKLAHPHANEIDSMTTYKHHCYALTIYIKDNNTETKLEEFDVDTRTWTILASMPWKAALRYTSLVATSDAVYVVGGLNKASISVNYFVEVDLATGKTTELTPMPSYRSACSCAFVDGRLYVAGGFTRNADHSASMCDRFEVYRVKNKSWKKLPSTHFGVSIVALRGETVISVGGVVPYSRDVKMFDRESKEWTELPPMIWERCMPGVCAVGACGIIVGGGATGNGEPLKSVEEMLLMKV
ncbi:kelch domain-containing protein 8B-like [Oscarella lobularis]|uniref:kelch domain-containing protein 8B-like n=1 Tax=Oscarella lobularis TaxID=121494 RepID=UPI0033137033